MRLRQPSGFLETSSDFPDVLTNERGFLYTPQGLVAILDWYISRKFTPFRKLMTHLHRGQNADFLWRTARRFGMPEKGRADLYDRIQGVTRSLQYDREKILSGERELLLYCQRGKRLRFQAAFLLHCPMERVQRLTKLWDFRVRVGN